MIAYLRAYEFNNYERRILPRGMHDPRFINPTEAPL